MLSVAFFTPTPDRARAVALTAAAVGIEPFELETMSASALVERLFESDAVRVAVTALPAINLFGDLLSPGQGALAWLWTFLMRACTVSRDDPTLAQAVERAFLAHGGVLFKATTATRLVRDDNGRCCGVEIENNGARQVFRARHGVISDLGASLTSALVEKQLRSEWRSAGRTVFTADVVSTVLWHGRLKRSTARPASISSGRAGPIVSGGSGWRETNRKRCSLDTSTRAVLQFLRMRGGWERPALRVRFGTGPFLNSEWDARRVHSRMTAVSRSAHPCVRPARRQLNRSSLKLRAITGSGIPQPGTATRSAETSSTVNGWNSVCRTRLRYRGSICRTRCGPHRCPGWRPVTMQRRSSQPMRASGARLVVQHATSAFSTWRYAATVIRWRVTEAIKIEKTSQGRNHMKYKLLVGLVAALASSLLVSAAAKVDDPAITIAVGVDPAFTPFFVADAQGMFKKEGLNVQIQQHANAGVAADALVPEPSKSGAGVPGFQFVIPRRACL